MTKKQLRQMDFVEFREWAAFYLLEPFGDEYRQTCGIRADIKNAFGGKQGGGLFKENDLMPTALSRMDHAQTANEMEAILMASLGVPNG